jgi:hypothetical protein
LPVHIEPGNVAKNKDNVLMHITGTKGIPLKVMKTNTFLPGAIADHLTSFGGKLTDSNQTSAIEWLQAGATGSYGTAIEPCNFLQKFPNPLIAMTMYLRGGTLIEAYWKSVLMPGQGVFIGEPLAAPYRGYRFAAQDGKIFLYSPVLKPGLYRLLGANSIFASYQELSDNIDISSDNHRIYIQPPYKAFYKLEPVR